MPRAEFLPLHWRNFIPAQSLTAFAALGALLLEIPSSPSRLLIYNLPPPPIPFQKLTATPSPKAGKIDNT